MIGLNKDRNEVILGFADETFKSGLNAGSLNWVSIPEPLEPFSCQAKIRSSQKPVNVNVTPDGQTVKVEFEDLQKALTPGQSIVFYRDSLLLGGGFIESVF